MELNWVKIVAAVIAVWGVLGMLMHPGLISLLMAVGGGYVAFTGDVKFTVVRQRISSHFTDKKK